MIQFLRRLWMRCAPSTPTEPEQSAFPALPDDLGKDEYIARFIFDKRHLTKGDNPGQPRPQAFKPEYYQGNWELSVCRNTGLAEGRIWEISRTCRPGMVALARADVGMSAVHETQLMARYAEGAYPEHAVVLGWPVSGEKDAQMMHMVALASASQGRFPPSS